MKNQIPCQDKTKTSFDNETYVIALSDGAGSAKLSHYGAECVVDSVTELLTLHFDELFSNVDGRQVKLLIVKTVLTAIHETARNLGCTYKDLAATLMAVAVKEDKFIIAHIGDGVVGYLDGDALKIASSPSNGEHANETFFVTSVDAIAKMNLLKGFVKNIAGFVLMSDGTEQSLYNKKSNALSPAVIKLMQRNLILNTDAMNDQLEATFRNLIITKTLDDCSLALLSREKGVLHSFDAFDLREKCDLYGITDRIKNKSVSKNVMRYDQILELLQTPSSCRAISRKIHLKVKYTKRHLRYLCDLGFVTYSNGLYRTR